MLKRFYIRDEAAREVQKDLAASISATFKRNLRELRFLGYGLGLGLQSPTDADDTAIANVRLFAALRTQNPRDIRALQQIMSLPDDLALRLPQLQKGEVIVAGVGITEPRLIYYPAVAHAGYVSQAELQARQAAEFTRLEREIVRAREKEDDLKTYVYLEMLGERVVEQPHPPEVPDAEIQKGFFDDHRALLHKVHQNPDRPTAQHYRDLKWGSGRGTRVKEDLLAWGLIRCERKGVQEDPTKGGRPAEIMTITLKGERFLNE